MSAESAIKNLESQVFSVTCRRCNHVYNDEDHQPRLLPCLHDVCLDCLCELVIDETLTCPECKSAHNTPDNDVTVFPTDPVKLGRVLQNPDALSVVCCDFCDSESAATHRCVDCLDNLCTNCLQIHKKYKKYRNHNVLSISEYANLQYHVNTTSKCNVSGHTNEEIKFYCTDKECERCLCPSCVISHIEHSHRVLKIDTVFDLRLKNIKSIESDLQQQKEKTDETIRLIEEETISVDKMAKDAIKDAEMTYDNLIKLLEKRKSDVQSYIKLVQENKRELLKNQEREIQMRRNALEDGKLYLQNLLESGNKSEFLSIEPIIRKQFSKLINEKQQSLPCISQTIRFSSQNKIEELEDLINDMGLVVFSNAFAPFTKVHSPNLGYVGEIFEVRLQVFNYNQEVIQEEAVDVQICLIDPTEKLTRSLYPCQLDDDGSLRTCFCVEFSGVYSIKVFLLGKPFYMHNHQLEIIERFISQSEVVYEPCNDAMRSPIPDLVRSQGDMKPLSSPRRPYSSTKSGRCRMTFTCPSFHLDESTLHKNCFLSQCKRIISNIPTAHSQYHTTLTNKGSVYNGAAGSVSFFYPCAAYFEVEIKYDIWKDLCLDDVICEVIITNEDLSEFTTTQLHHKLGWSFCVLFCEKCHQVCIECWDHEYLMDHLPVGLVTRNSSLDKVIGIFLDDTNACISLVDCTESDLIVQFNDAIFETPLWPAFCVQPSEKFAVELKITTGQEIDHMPVHLIPT